MMRLYLVASTLACLFGAALSTETQISSALGANWTVHERADQVPGEWKYVGPAKPFTIVQLSIALRQPGVEDLRHHLDMASNPEHVRFGAHLTKEEVELFQRPEERVVETVLSWLEEGSINDFRQNGAWIQFNTSVERANALLDCQLERYLNPEGQAAYRASQYSLPPALAAGIEFVYPVTQFVRHPSKKSPKTQDAKQSERRQDSNDLPPACDQGITPNCVAALYNITYIPPDKSDSSLGIVGFLEQYPSIDALQDFLAAMSPRRNQSGYLADYAFKVQSINGGNATVHGSGIEALLDTECIMPFTQPLDVTYYSTGGRGPEIDPSGEYNNVSVVYGNEPWLDFINYLLTLDDIPQVISISYTDDEQSIPPAYASRVCDGFMAISARGVSILVSSGDGGTAGTGVNQCYVTGTTHTRTEFLPTFPASCPYVTAVGGTSNYARNAVWWGSSGGFSNYFSRPSWQTTAASTYLTLIGSQHQGWFNLTGRGIPDISAIGSRVVVGDGSVQWTQSGTSASAPIVAAIIALVNDKRLRNGKPSLGFLNPMLYSLNVSSALYDVTEGTSGSCPYGNKVEPGWEAMAGWDPVSGLGTPDLLQLLDILG